MISVMVLYPNEPGSHFDIDYYVNRHLKLVRDRLEPLGMRSMTFAIEAATDLAATPQAFRLVADLRFDDIAATRRALSAHGAETQADIPNFTNVAPVILIGETKTA
jgi:uncharacterized protein (TIGR02118 family)